MKKIIAVFIFLVLISFNLIAQQKYKKFTQGHVVFLNSGFIIKVELAATEMQRSIGLMYRESLAAEAGMLFAFEEDAVQRVWMKNTLIPLDIVFISNQGEIVSIIQQVQPCRKKVCEVYHSTKTARYMLELNAGMVEKKGIKVTEKIQFQPL